MVLVAMMKIMVMFFVHRTPENIREMSQADRDNILITVTSLGWDILRNQGFQVDQGIPSLPVQGCRWPADLVRETVWPRPATLPTCPGSPPAGSRWPRYAYLRRFLFENYYPGGSPCAVSEAVQGGGHHGRYPRLERPPEQEVLILSISFSLSHIAQLPGRLPAHSEQAAGRDAAGQEGAGRPSWEQQPISS